MTERSPRDPAADLRCAAWIAVCAFAFYALVNCGYIDNVDSETQQLTARNILAGRGFGLESVNQRMSRWMSPGPDGREYMQYGPGNVLLHLPPLVLASLAGVGSAAAEAKLASFIASFVGPLFAAIGAAGLFLLARRLGLSTRAALGAAAIHGLATFAVVYARSSYYETPITALLVLCAYFAVDPNVRTRTAVLGGAALGLALTLKFVWLIAIPPLALLVFVPGGGSALRRGAAFLVPVVLTLAGLAMFNVARFGSALVTGYDEGLPTPPLEGLSALLFSGHGSYLLYSPVLLLAVPGVWHLWRLSRVAAASVALLVLVAFGLHAHAFAPAGGSVYGPRYLLPITPFLALAAMAYITRARGVWRGAALALVVASALLQVPALTVSFRDYWAVRRAVTPAQRAELPPPLGVYARLAAAAVVSPGEPLTIHTVGVESGDTPDALATASTGLDWWWLRAAGRYHPAIAWAAPLALLVLALTAGARAASVSTTAGPTRGHGTSPREGRPKTQ